MPKVGAEMVSRLTSFSISLARFDVERYRLPLLVALSIVGPIFTVAIFAMRGGQPGPDIYAYWAVDQANPYRVDIGFAAFHYAPPVAWLAIPLALIPWPLIYFVWTGILLAALAWLGGRWFLATLAFPPVSFELYHSNIHLLLAVAVVLGFRYPWTWAFVLLTKVTPGVGLVWFAVRREWRSLGIALGATAAISAVSFAVAPNLWFQWIDHLRVTGTYPGDGALIDVPLALRLPLSAVLVIWGARTDRPWTVVAAGCLALPLLWVNGPAMLVGIIAVQRMRTRILNP